jgi:hypothetical protein
MRPNDFEIDSGEIVGRSSEGAQCKSQGQAKAQPEATPLVSSRRVVLALKGRNKFAADLFRPFRASADFLFHSSQGR